MVHDQREITHEHNYNSFCLVNIEFTTLKEHLHQYSMEKPHVCEVCNKAFSECSALDLHLRTHTKEKPHVCETCNKAFSHSGNLIQHLLIHTKEKPH
ncbi:UNVERIFIED_CONTAM: zinc finger protein, partial [Trichonephila clavipes]